MACLAGQKNVSQRVVNTGECCRATLQASGWEKAAFEVDGTGPVSQEHLREMNLALARGSRTAGTSVKQSVDCMPGQLCSGCSCRACISQLIPFSCGRGQAAPAAPYLQARPLRGLVWEPVLGASHRREPGGTAAGPTEATVCVGTCSPPLSPEQFASLQSSGERGLWPRLPGREPPAELIYEEDECAAL